MSVFPGRRLQYAAACLAVALYAGLSYISNSSAGARDLGTALALVPTAAVAAVIACRSARPAIAASICAALLGLVAALWPLLRQNYPLIDLIQDSSAYGLLGISFGRSLMAGRLPLCTRLAEREHGPLSAGELRYTRQVTIAWTCFFLAVTAASILLFVSAPFRFWSLFVNFCVMPLVAAMFTAEYLVRRRVLPAVRRTGLLGSLRAYLAANQREPV